jgi:hypothetical protein
MRLHTVGWVLLGMAAASVQADTLTTPSFEVRITVNCPEGHISCDDVTYVGKKRKTGQSIRLKGSTWHTRCADGVAPCRFMGYQFHNGKVIYSVMEEGYLRVTQGKKLLLEEQGEWEYGNTP